MKIIQFDSHHHVTFPSRLSLPVRAGMTKRWTQIILQSPTSRQFCFDLRDFRSEVALTCAHTWNCSLEDLPHSVNLYSCTQTEVSFLAGSRVELRGVTNNRNNLFTSPSRAPVASPGIGRSSSLRHTKSDREKGNHCFSRIPQQ